MDGEPQLLRTKSVRSPMPTTRWTSVLVAGSGADDTRRREALEVLSREYWPAVYSYIRIWGRSPADAEDLTQAFLADFIARNSFAGAAPENGKFRSWLLAALKHFLLAEKRTRSALKRGGGAVHVSIDRELAEGWFEQAQLDSETPETLFERRWATGILERAIRGLEEWCRREGREAQFETLLPLVAGLDDRGGYADAAASLRITEGNARVASFRLRKRLRTLVREEVAATVAEESDVDQELEHFFSALRGG